MTEFLPCWSLHSSLPASGKRNVLQQYLARARVPVRHMCWEPGETVQLSLADDLSIRALWTNLERLPDDSEVGKGISTDGRHRFTFSRTGDSLYGLVRDRFGEHEVFGLGNDLTIRRLDPAAKIRCSPKIRTATVPFP